jgi:hypothetical protein
MSPALPAFLGVVLALGTSRLSGWPPVTDTEVKHDTSLVQATRTMTLDLPAAADKVFPLFGPVRESEWSPDWRPAFVTPLAREQTSDGAVFTVEGDPDSAVWVMTDYEPDTRRVRYVIVRPGALVTQLWIEVRSTGPNASQADVTYRTTLLGPAGRPALDHFISGFAHRKPHWEHAIRTALEARR